MRSSLAPQPSPRAALDPLGAGGGHAGLAEPAHLDDEPLTLPPPWTPPPRPPLPVVAAVVPLVGAVALWLVTGSVLSLWLALLGPLIAVATMADARRAARRDRRRATADAAAARERVAAAVVRRHEIERRRLWARHPDVARLVTHDEAIWRAGLDAIGLVVGAGEVASRVRVVGGEGDPDAADLRRRSARLGDGPIVVRADEGIVVVGAGAAAVAVHRALVLQLCLIAPPGEVRIVGAARGWASWTDALPHRAASAGVALALPGPGEQAPPEARITIARCAPGEPLPPRCGAVLTVRSPDAAVLERAGERVPLRVEAVGESQAGEIAAKLASRAEHSLGLARGAREPVQLSSLVAAAPVAGRDRLPAVVGVAGGEPMMVDLVADGPHAVVIGVTGSGKSELLITWILALCATHTTDEVTFLLADFKGGTAFDTLIGVPHVTGVITDLDGAGARRAIESLRAELRRREGAIAGAGARDILDPRVELPRLVVVVDEFAALLGDHPEMTAIFADVAARGRALGIHLIIGTQRAAGVIRENLLANCPLRVSLRVTDAADSRALLGTDEAARLPGGVHGRGIALVRRAGDAVPQRVTIALSGPDDVAAAIAHAGERAPRRPWLPALPTRVRLADLADHADPDRPHDPAAPGVRGQRLLLALADEPALQRQRIVALSPSDRGVLMLGGAGSGVTNALELIAVQSAGEVTRVPSDSEGLWDTVAALAERMPAPGTLILIDDLDALATRLPSEYAQTVIERLETMMRRAGDAGVLVLVGAHRLTGAVSRIADLIPRRLLLPYANRTDHAAAGGDPGHFDPDAGPGRGRWAGLTVQVALAPERPVPSAAQPSPWHPSAPLTGFVARRSPAPRAALEAWERRGARLIEVDRYASDPGDAEGRVVVVGEPDEWQRHWRLLADLRGDHDLVVDTSCAAELRLLISVRDAPPYCEPGAGRAWLVSAGAPPARIVLPRIDA
ncbi:FtsK/SpoIIIE domain-containing protein [Microbacterium sp. HD4P20]|uniref:FtsK/SpoIIIE domain-containing protein n=1 Tax=Microbacterium sp. HD4P20 TaxID=2864874 RepID=UPI001C63B962|nr:FtsK/SpoIIIE domain-containing protein [Microbacterium sp. HD4P20]MCP2637369.1 FtsK/SpoIIIE domain-containing protein [Microbacterium sp. HD4P20]